MLWREEKDDKRGGLYVIQENVSNEMREEGNRERKKTAAEYIYVDNYYGEITRLIL